MHFDLNKHNIGDTDRLIRAIVGALLIVSTLLGTHWLVGLVGAVLLVTAYYRFCPAYALFDFSTTKGVGPLAK
jgi:hypothetical protein